MPKVASTFTDTRILLAQRGFPVRREISWRDVINMRSHWPFTVEDGGGARETPNADKQPLAHPGTVSFIS
ncbi:MAG: hypothetical protein ABIR56_00250 [Polaromonas sp.]